MRATFHEFGFYPVRTGLDGPHCLELETLLAPVVSKTSRARVHGLRNLLKESPSIAAWASQGALVELAAAVLGKPCRPVKGIYFNKSPEANWVVGWHQDLTIALAEPHEVSGFTNWTNKHGAWHVQPPVSVLEDQVTLRIHLDDCSEANGALNVAPGSHRLGRLDPDRIRQLRNTLGGVSCTARRGDVLVMSPLLLHASPKALEPSHRRIVHVEYSAAALPAPLKWFV